MTTKATAEALNTLREIAQFITTDQSTEHQIDALEKFIVLCQSAVEITPDVCFSAFSGDTELPQGIAINPAAAAQCVKDYIRTIKFVNAVHHAITQQHALHPGSTLKILYAGCGPFATLLLPLLALHCEKEMSIHFLDIHEESLSSVQTLMQFFNFDQLRLHYHCDNACHFQAPDPFDIIVAETMQKALEQEPQFMVTAQLADQLKPTGIFIPEEIFVSLALQDRETLVFKNKSKPLLALSSQCPLFSKLNNAANQNSLRLPLTQFHIPELYNSVQQRFVLQTRIQVLNDIWLYEDESDITLTVPAFSLDNALPNQVWHAQYYYGSYPCIEFQHLSL